MKTSINAFYDRTEQYEIFYKRLFAKYIHAAQKLNLIKKFISLRFRDKNLFYSETIESLLNFQQEIVALISVIWSRKQFQCLCNIFLNIKRNFIKITQSR
jgi:hypothetical protein